MSVSEDGLFAPIVCVVLLGLIHALEDQLGIHCMGFRGALVAGSGLPLSFMGKLVRDV